jgi:hypothetical protein
MKECPLTAVVILATMLEAAAVVSPSIYTYSGPGYSIPDGNPNAVWSSIAVSGEGSALLDVSVTLNLTGGYNGDLYAYLSYGGNLVPLLNRIGLSGSNPFGFDGAGMNVTFSDGAIANIHAAGNGYLNGTYQADGQNISPLSSAGSFNPNGGAITLNGTFGNLDPNGSWTLFIADVVSGGGSSTLSGWSLQITPVPEPSALSLGVVSLILAGACRNRFWWEISRQSV